MALLAAERYRREDCAAAARRGGEFIIRAQLPAPLAGWAQQYSHDLQPAKARAFEPAAVCAAVTARNLRTLRVLHRRFGDERFLAPFSAARAWLRKSRLDDGRWARFVHPETGKPIYADRDGSAMDDIFQMVLKGRD